MSEPVIIIDSSEVREGKLGELLKAMRELVEFVRANEPRITAYEMYLDEDGAHLTVMQVHPDPASAEFHMDIAGPAFPRFVELIRMSRIDVYGAPSAELLERLRRKGRMLGAQDVKVHGPQAGFARFGAVGL